MIRILLFNFIFLLGYYTIVQLTIFVGNSSKIGNSISFKIIKIVASKENLRSGFLIENEANSKFVRFTDGVRSRLPNCLKIAFNVYLT